MAITTADIDAKITAISKAVDVVLSGGKSYTLNDGQGSITVTRSTLSELQKALSFWRGEKTEVELTRGTVGVDGGIISINTGG